MEKTSIQSPGRHKKIINNRLRRIENNHFLKKLSTKIVNTAMKPSIKAAKKEVAGKVGEEKANEMFKELRDSKTYDTAQRKTVNMGSAVLGTALALGAVAGGAAAGIGAAGGGSAGAAGAGAAGAGSGGTLAGGGSAIAAGGGLLASNRKPTTPITEVKTPNLQNIKIPGYETKPKPQGALYYNPENPMSTDPIADLLRKAEQNKTVQTVKNLAGYIPPEVKKQLIKTGKSKLGIDDVVANSRTSPELLPKNRALKLQEGVASKNSDTEVMRKLDEKQNLGGLSFTNQTWLIVGGIILTIVLIVALRK